MFPRPRDQGQGHESPPLGTTCMKGKPKKSPREKDMTSRYLAGGMDEDRIESGRAVHARNKEPSRRTRADRPDAGGEEQSGVDIESLPLGEVLQVYSPFSEVGTAASTFLCVVRKTLTRSQRRHDRRRRPGPLSRHQQPRRGWKARRRSRRGSSSRCCPGKRC